jgi:hypothetical protein
MAQTHSVIVVLTRGSKHCARPTLALAVEYETAAPLVSAARPRRRARADRGGDKAERSRGEIRGRGAAATAERAQSACLRTALRPPTHRNSLPSPLPLLRGAYGRVWG